MLHFAGIRSTVLLSLAWKILAGNFWWKLLEEMPYLISLNPLHFKNIAYIGPWKHFVFVCVCVSLYLSFCKSSSRSLSSPDDKLLENIWFVWSRTSHRGDKLFYVERRRRYYQGDKKKHTQTRECSATQSVDTVIDTIYTVSETEFLKI